MTPSDSWKPLDIDNPDAGLVPLPPSDVCVVAFLAAPRSREGGWAARAAIELARGWGAQGARVVLCDVGVEHPELHTAAGLDNLEGISDALIFGTSFQRLSQPLSDGLFLATAGTAVPDAEALRAHPRWRDFASGFAEAGAILAVYMPWDAPGADALLKLADAEVLLATRDEAAAAAPSPRRPLLAAVGPGVPQEAADPDPADLPVEVEAGAVDEPPVTEEEPPATGAPDIAAGGELWIDPFAYDGEEPAAGELEAPDEPEAADEPGTPDGPAVLDGPEAPDEPGTPDELEAPSVPGVPDPLHLPDELEVEVVSMAEVSVTGEVGPYDSILQRGPLTPEGILGNRPPPAQPGEAPSDLPPTPAEAQGPREKNGSARVPILGAVLVVVVLVLGRLGILPIPWLRPGDGTVPPPGQGPAAVAETPSTGQEEGSGEEGPESGDETTAPPAQEGAAVPSGDESRPVRPDVPPTEPTEVTEAPTGPTPAAAFAVTLGSYANLDSAMARARILDRAYPQFQFFVAPVEVSGRPYFRLVAGSAPDASSGAALRDRLTSTIPGAGDWILRQARLGYLVGARPTLGLAREQAGVLEGMGIPVHILRYADEAGATEYRVYAGAYANEGEARYMGRLLEENNIQNAVLTERRGVRPE